jgi:hypothetical protein
MDASFYLLFPDLYHFFLKPALVIEIIGNIDLLAGNQNCTQFISNKYWQEIKWAYTVHRAQNAIHNNVFDLVRTTLEKKGLFYTKQCI